VFVMLRWIARGRALGGATPGLKGQRQLLGRTSYHEIVIEKVFDNAHGLGLFVVMAITPLMESSHATSRPSLRGY